MKRTIIGVILWFACGVYGGGSFLAGCPYEFPLTYEQHGPESFYVGAAVITLTGPVGAVLVNVDGINPMNMYGWRWRLKRDEESK